MTLNLNTQEMDSPDAPKMNHPAQIAHLKLLLLTITTNLANARTTIRLLDTELRYQRDIKRIYVSGLPIDLAGDLGMEVSELKDMIADIEEVIRDLRDRRRAEVKKRVGLVIRRTVVSVRLMVKERWWRNVDAPCFGF